MTKADASDGELIERARSGDQEAFRMLVERYEPAVARTVVGMLGQTEEARDVGQQVFIRFFRACGDFRGDSSLKTYLTRIAINLSLNELKRRKRFRKRFVGLDYAERIPASVTTPFSDDVRLVRRAVAELDEPFRAVVQLRLIEGYSVKETAEILEIPTGTVLSRLSRAQRKLARRLSPILNPGRSHDQ